MILMSVGFALICFVISIALLTKMFKKQKNIRLNKVQKIEEK